MRGYFNKKGGPPSKPVGGLSRCVAYVRGEAELNFRKKRGDNAAPVAKKGTWSPGRSPGQKKGTGLGSNSFNRGREGGGDSAWVQFIIYTPISL